MLSIELSNTCARLVEGDYRRGAVHIKRFDTLPLPEGCVKNGIILNSAELAEALRTCIRKNGFQSKKAVITINSTAIVTREVTVPDVREKEMPGLLQGEIEQASSSKQDYVLDYIVLERLQQQDAAMCRVLCVVVPRVIVEGCRDLLERQLGLKAQAMDVLMHTVYKLVCRDPLLHSGDAVVMANVQEDELCLVLAEGDSKVFYRTTPVSATQNVVESEYILSSFGGNELLSEERRREQIYYTVSENISKLMQFQIIKNKEKPVSRVLVYGGLSDNTDLISYVSDHVGVDARRIERPDFVEGPSGMDFHLYLNAISALIAL